MASCFASLISVLQTLRMLLLREELKLSAKCKVKNTKCKMKTCTAFFTSYFSRCTLHCFILGCGSAAPRRL